MVEQTGHEIRVGDLEGVDASVGDRAEPQLAGEGDVDARHPPGRDDVTRVAPPLSARAVGGSVAATGKGRDRRNILLVWLLIGLTAACVALMGLAGMFYSQQKQMAVSIATLEASSAKSVQYLESRVASTNSTLRSADAETQKSFNVVAADIGRLNDGLNRTGQQLEQQRNGLAATAADLKALAADVRRVAQTSEQADADAAARLKALADSLDQLAARQKAQGDVIAQMQKSGEIVQLRSDVAVLSGSLRELEDAHDRRLKAAEQAIASNDAFRRQVNSAIDRLTQQVSELYQRR